MLTAVVSKNRQKLIYRFRNLNSEVNNGLSLLHLIDILYSNYHEKNDNNMQLKESSIYCIRFWVTILFNVIRLFNFQERFPLILAKFIGTSKYRILSSCNDRRRNCHQQHSPPYELISICILHPNKVISCLALKVSSASPLILKLAHLVFILSLSFGPLHL